MQKQRKVDKWLSGGELAAQKLSGVGIKVAVGFNNREEICDLDQQRVVEAKDSL